MATEMADLTHVEALHTNAKAFVTEWHRWTKKLEELASVFDAKGGRNQFDDLKIDKGEGVPLTGEEQAYNDKLEQWADDVYDVAVHLNELMTWYDQGRQNRVLVLHTDY